LLDSVGTPPAWGIAVRDDGLTYFTEPYNAGVGITSTTTRTLDGFIPTGQDPTGVAFAPDGATAYVTNQSSNNVGVIDAASAQQVATIPIPNGASPFVVRVSPDGSRLFISTNTTTVYIVDTKTRAIIGSVQVGFAPNGFAVHPDGRIIYVSAFVGGTVTEVDMFTGTVLRTFTVGGTPQDMAVTRDGERLYVGNEAGYLNEVDLMSGQTTATIPLAGGAFGIGVTPDDNQAYVSIPAAGLVQIFNLQSRKLAQTLPVGGNPRRLAFSQQGHIGAIANLNGYVTFVR
jgi:YVTN family beta-propeller protein